MDRLSTPERKCIGAYKVKGRKRNALVDTDGRALILQTGSAAIQDRDGAVPLLVKSRNRFPFIERVFADSAYAGEQVANATQIAVEIVRAKPGQIGFAVQPRRWVVTGCTKVPAYALSGWNGSSGFTCGQNFTPSQPH